MATGTSGGKDHPLKSASKLLRAAKLGGLVLNRFESEVVLIDDLQKCPVRLATIDELGSYIAQICGQNASQNGQKVSKTLRKASTARFDEIRRTSAACCADKPNHVMAPGLVILGATTVGELFNNLDEAEISNGLVNRMTYVFKAGERSRRRHGETLHGPVPDHIAKMIYTKSLRS